VTDKELLIKAIIDNGWFKKGQFKLSSGKESDFYIDMRPCMLQSRTIHLITTCFTQLLTQHSLELTRNDLFCGVITSGLFLTGAMLQRLSVTWAAINAIYVRTEHRMHGSLRDIEGIYKAGQRVILIDDVATTGKSLCKVRDILVSHNLHVAACAVIVDREEGAEEALGVPLLSILKVSDLKTI